MTTSQIGSTVSVSTDTQLEMRDTLCYNLATDLLKGCTSDYLYFFNGSGQVNVTTYYDEYVLIVGNLDSYASTGQFQFSDCTVFQIYGVREMFLPVDDFSFSGNSLDVSSSPLGTFSGSGTIRSRDYYYTSSYYFYTKDSVTVNYSVGQVLYSSYDNFPHLIEGSEFYGFSTCVLLSVGFVFLLISRIFRRLY